MHATHHTSKDRQGYHYGFAGQQLSTELHHSATIISYLVMVAVCCQMLDNSNPISVHAPLGMSDLPSVHAPLGMSDLPSVHALLGMSDLPSVHALLGMSDLPSVHAPLGMPDLPSVHALYKLRGELWGVLTQSGLKRSVYGTKEMLVYVNYITTAILHNSPYTNCL